MEAITYTQALQNLAIAIEKAIPCNRVGMAVVGLEVPITLARMRPW